MLLHAVLVGAALWLDARFYGHPVLLLFIVMLAGPLLMNMLQVRSVSGAWCGCWTARARAYCCSLLCYPSIYSGKDFNCPQTARLLLPLHFMSSL